MRLNRQTRMAETDNISGETVVAHPLLNRCGLLLTGLLFCLHPDIEKPFNKVMT